MQLDDDLQAEAPPSKRARLEGTGETTVDKMEDNHAMAAEELATETSVISPTEFHGNHIFESAAFNVNGIPGLGLIGQDIKHEQIIVPNDSAEKIPEPTSDHIHHSVDHANQPAQSQELSVIQNEEDEGNPSQNPDEKSARAESPFVTAALESLLGGITPPVSTAENSTMQSGSNKQDLSQSLDREDNMEMNNEISEMNVPEQLDDKNIGESSSEAPDTQLLDGDVPSNSTPEAHESKDSNEAEFELDSSPYQSSSEDDTESDDSSSSDDSEGEDDYQLLGPEEQARILMEGDGGSDDEGGGKGAKGGGGQLRTKNEVPEEIIPKPDVIITQEMGIEELGEVEAIVENVLLIKAKTSGEYKVLESGSVLCLADRSVIGVVSETLGRVQQPFYSVRFTNPEEMAKAGLAPTTKVFYSKLHSTYVFTQTLKAYKGSDASNIHDEEVGDEEIEFSDDEAEAEHKRRIKQKRVEKRGGKMQHNSGSTKGGHPLQQQQAAYDPMVGLNYDDEDGGPYKPLSRPASFADNVGRTEAPQEGAGYSGQDHRSSNDGRSFHNRSRDSNGRGRGRGDRGRGRGGGNDRGRGQAGFRERRNDGFSQPPHDRQNSYGQPPQGMPISPQSPTNGYNYYNHAVQDQYNPQPSPSPVAYTAPPFQYPQAYMPPQQYQHPQQYAPVGPPQHGWPNVAPSPTIAAGAYINPAFFVPPQQPPPGQQWAPNPQPYRDPAADRAFHEAQERLNILKNLSGKGGNM